MENGATQRNLLLTNPLRQVLLPIPPTMNIDKHDQNIGYEYAAADSRLARFIDEQHRLLEKARIQISHLKEDLKFSESEADYWKSECEKSDSRLRKLLNPNG